MNLHTAYRFLSIFLLCSLLSVLVVGSTPVQPSMAAEISKDSHPGVTYLTGPNQGDPLDIALTYIRRNSNNGLTSDDLQDFIVTDQYVSEHTGTTHIYLRQRYLLLEIFQANININIARNGAVINQGGAFIANLTDVANSPIPSRSAIQSIESAATHLGLKLTIPPTLLSASDQPDRAAVFSAVSSSAEPMRARLVYHVLDSTSLRLAWNLEISEPGGLHYWNLLVDANNGEILAKFDQVLHDHWGGAQTAFDQRSANNSLPVNIAAFNNRVSSLNAPDIAASYNVFALPKESPSDGTRSVVFPEDVTASPFGWHDTNGVAGAEYTVTRGNNAYAYTDLNADNLPDLGSSPDGGSSLIFDFPLDLNLTPDTYRPLAVTNMFYWTNILHDVLYRYGFTELAGNFQTNNYGKGAYGNDAVLAEAQDGSGTNNANFWTGADGSAPRMQMYIWIPPDVITLTVNSPAGIAGNYLAAPAIFGPSTFDITGDTVEAYDGAGLDLYDACETITNNLTGMIALINRGNCYFIDKVLNAQNAGAIGVIMINNVPGAPISMSGTGVSIVIPSVMVSDLDGALFRANLPNVRIQRHLTTSPNRDSDLDAGVIAHEYAHGLSLRLTGGPSTVSCLNNAEQMGEGWSDFIALVLTTHPSDTSTSPRGVGTYLLFQPPTGPGIRPTPYTTDLSVNPSTYESIATMMIPHGVGYVWASILWEVYWNLVANYGYNPDVYSPWDSGGNNLAIQLVIDGMLFQPCSPGFVDGRDAILVADQDLTGGVNYCTIYAAFAKRGLGYSATQGSSDSITDGTQAFDMPPYCAPNISTNTSLLANLLPDQLGQQSFDIMNLGGVDLTWSISEADSDCSSPADLPWVSAGTTSSVTGPELSTSIPLTFDASGLSSGAIHNGLICIASDDPAEPLLSIPISLQVNFPVYLPILVRP